MVEDAIRTLETRGDLPPVVVVSTLDLGVEPVEKIILLEPDPHLVSRVGSDVRKKDTGEAPRARLVLEAGRIHSAELCSRIRVR